MQMDELFTALYMRVSTEGQDETMQFVAAQPFLKNLPQERLKTFVDHGVSATKVPMARRPQLQALLEMVKSGKVGTLIVYERDRLARNAFEYMSIVKLLRIHKVKVIFTASSARPFDQSMIVEGISAIAAASEAQAIQRRATDTQQQYPAQRYGYTRMKGEDGYVRYHVIEELAEPIRDLFRQIAISHSDQEFVNAVEHFRRLSGRPQEKILKMLQTPFYCGHAKRHDSYHPMQHVEPMVSLELFLGAQEVIESKEHLTRNVSATNLSPMVQPICGLCGEKMALKMSLGHSPVFECRRNRHRVNQIDLREFNEAVHRQLTEHVQSIDIQKLRKICTEHLRGHDTKFSQAETVLRKQHTDLSLSIARRYDPTKTGKDLELAFNKLEKIAGELTLIGQSRREIQAAMTLEIDQLAELVKAQLTVSLKDEAGLRGIASLLYKHVVVHEEWIEIQMYYQPFMIGGEGHGQTA